MVFLMISINISINANIQTVKEAFEYKEKIKYNGRKTETHNKFHNEKSVVKISEKKRHGARNTQKQRIYRELDEHEDE